MDDGIKIARCARCKKTYVKIRFPVCDDCIDDEEADFKTISNVLAENSNQNVEIVANLAGVTPECVLRMLDRGLIATEMNSLNVRCGRCGEPAISPAQRLCQRCLIQLDQTFFAEISEARRVRQEREKQDSVHEAIDKKRKTVIKPKNRNLED